jgi:PAS domain S-box-containing protein
MTPNGSKRTFPFVADVALQAGDIVFATDRFGSVVYWNEEAAAISGYKAEEVMGKPYSLACRMEPDVAAPDLSAILAGHDFAGGVRCRSRRGGDVALYLFATAGRNPAGEPSGIVFVGRDVTGLWRAEEAAQAADDKYRVLFQNSLDSVAIADMDGEVLEANPACLRLYGLSVEEVRGMHLTDAVAPEDRSAAADAMANLVMGRLVTRTLRMRRKDGTRFVVDLLASVMVVGGERRIMAVTRDVTERVRAEQAGNQSDRMYRTVFESANDAVFIESVDGRILDVNRHGCELLGYRRDELVKMHVSDLVPTEARAWLPLVTDAILREKTFRTEAVNVHKSGRQIPVEMSASTMELNGKTVVLAIVRDITERKQAEVALADSENRYRTLFNDSLTGIYRTTPDGRILLANPALLRMLGYDSFAQVAERNLETDGSGPEYKRDEFKHRLEREGRIVGLEASWQTRDGRSLQVRENARAVRGQDGAVLYYEGTVEDITDRKAAEQALRESEGKFRSVSEQSPNMIFINSRGRVVYANQKSVDIMGYTREELYAPGFDFMRLIAPESAEQIKAVYARHAHGEDVEPYEYVLATKDGRRIEAIITTRLIDYEGDRAILGIVTDITDRKAAEHALRQEKELAHSYLEVAGVIMVVLDETGVVKLINQRGCEVLGGTSADIVGRSWFDTFIPVQLRTEVRRVFTGLIRGELEPVAHYENPVVTLRGEERLVAWHNALLRDETGRVVGTISSGEDITERKAAEQALRESERQYRTALEAMRDPVHVADANLRIVMVNQAFTAWLRENGFDDAVLGKGVFEVFPFLPDRVREEYRRVFDTGEPNTTEEETVVAGRTFITETTKMPVTEHGRVVRVLTAIRDVTERERLAGMAQETADELRAVLDNSPGAIVGECDGVLVYANQKYARLLGYDSPADIIGRTAADFDAPEDRELITSYTRMREQGKAAPTSYSFHALRRDGTILPLEATISTYRSLGRLHVLAFIREVEPGRGGS